jgi:hypothetical protein
VTTPDSGAREVLLKTTTKYTNRRNHFKGTGSLSIFAECPENRRFVKRMSLQRRIKEVPV